MPTKPNISRVALVLLIVLIVLVGWYATSHLQIDVSRELVGSDGRLSQAIEGGGTLSSIRAICEAEPNLFEKSYSPLGNPFDVALSHERLDVVQYFAEDGYEVNQQMHNWEYQDLTPLGYAVGILKSEEAVRVLLEFGADPTLTVNGGRSAAQIATDDDLVEILEMFKGKGVSE